MNTIELTNEVNERMQFALTQTTWTDEEKKEYIMSGIFPAPISALPCALKHFRYSHFYRTNTIEICEIFFDPIYGGLFQDCCRIKLITRDLSMIEGLRKSHQNGVDPMDNRGLANALSLTLGYTPSTIVQINKHYGF